MHSLKKWFELSLTSRDKVHQICARYCNPGKHDHGFVRQFNKWIFLLLHNIPIDHFENDFTGSTSGSRC